VTDATWHKLTLRIVAHLQADRPLLAAPLIARIHAAGRALPARALRLWKSK
jgi:hypothetical protein